MQQRLAGILREGYFLLHYWSQTTGSLFRKGKSNARHAYYKQDQLRIYYEDKMPNDNEKSSSLPLSDIISIASFGVVFLTALLYISGWTYAYYYFDRFRIPLLMLDLPKEIYLIYGSLVLWNNPVGTSITIVFIVALGWLCSHWSGYLGRFGVGALVLICMTGLFALGRAGGIASAQADFRSQRDSDYSAYPRLSLTLKKDSDETAKIALILLTKEECGRLILFNNDRLFIIHPIRGASAAQLDTFVIPADQIAALRIRAEYTSCS